MRRLITSLARLKMAAARQLWWLRRAYPLAVSRCYATKAAAEAKAVKAPVQVYGIEGRYAHAIFSAASRKSVLEKVEGELKGFQRLVVEHEKMADFMRNPTLAKSQKKVVVKGIMQDLKYSDLTSNLLATLIENSRLPRALGVVKAFSTIMGAYRGEVPCNVTTSKALDQKNQKELVKVLQGFLKKGEVLQLTMQTDPTIIGGMVVELGDQYIDMSTATKVRKIVTVIKQGL